MDVAILMTCYNRREKTLSCLFDCYRQIDAMSGSGTYSFSCYLVDDGSTDGTAEAVAQQFPQVRIIRSDGNLYWNQGMRLAWDTAASEKDFDFYLWINDDIRLHEGAIASLLENSEFFRHKAIVAGTAVDQDGNISYGGRTRSMKLIEPDPTIPVPCYLFNGNLVLVPKAAYSVLGNLDPSYTHSFGDFDYAVRAAWKDIPKVVCPGILCDCDRNPGIPAWADPADTLRKRYHSLLSPKGRPLGEQFRFDVRYMGLIRAVLHFISLNAKVLFPIKNYLRKTSDEQDHLHS